MERDSKKNKLGIALYLEGGTALAQSISETTPELPRASSFLIYKNRYLKYGRVLLSKKLRLSQHSTIEDYADLYKKIISLPEEIIIIITGTDNLPFLASYLDLHNNSKKIILTYSQRSLSRPTTDIFTNLDYLYENSSKIPKDDYYTIVYGTKNKKPGFYSSTIEKNHSYKKECFVETDRENTTRIKSDTGTLIPRTKSKFPSITINISTPLSFKKLIKNSKDKYVLLPGLGNPDLFSSTGSYYTYCKGPALSTYSELRYKVKNNWIRNIVKDYCLRYCSDERIKGN